MSPSIPHRFRYQSRSPTEDLSYPSNYETSFPSCRCCRLQSWHRSSRIPPIQNLGCSVEWVLFRLLDSPRPAQLDEFIASPSCPPAKFRVYGGWPEEEGSSTPLYRDGCISRGSSWKDEFMKIMDESCMDIHPALPSCMVYDDEDGGTVA